MIFHTYKPCWPLSRFVENFWLYRGYSAAHVRERIVPDGTFKIVFNLQHDEFRIHDPWRPFEFKRYSGAIASLPSGDPFVTESEQEAHVIGVNIRVGGALPIIGRAAAHTADSHVNLSDIWERDAGELHLRLTEHGDINDRFQLLEQALLSRLDARSQHHPAVSLALHSLGEAGPASRTREVAREAGLSQRRLITLFKHEVGMTPKLFARVRRFQRALRFARSTPLHWRDVAIESGYCDQSHMIRDFVAFSGLSPAEYLRVQGLVVQQGFRIKHNHIPLLD